MIIIMNTYYVPVSIKKSAHPTVIITDIYNIWNSKMFKRKTLGTGDRDSRVGGMSVWCGLQTLYVEWGIEKIRE